MKISHRKELNLRATRFTIFWLSEELLSIVSTSHLLSSQLNPASQIHVIKWKKLHHNYSITVHKERLWEVTNWKIYTQPIKQPKFLKHRINKTTGNHVHAPQNPLQATLNSTNQDKNMYSILKNRQDHQETNELTPARKIRIPRRSVVACIERKWTIEKSKSQTSATKRTWKRVCRMYWLLKRRNKKVRKTVKVWEEDLQWFCEAISLPVWVSINKFSWKSLRIYLIN